MAYQPLLLGTVANDGTGDDARAGGTKINANFVELYGKLGSGGVLFFGIAGPTAARSYTFPDADCTVLTNNAPVTIGQGGTGATTVAEAWAALTVPTVTSGGTAINWAAGPSHWRTLAANTTFTFSNATDGQTINVAITNTASNYTVTWPAVSWSGGSAPVQTVGAKTDVYTFTKIGSTIYGSVVQDF